MKISEINPNTHFVQFNLSDLLDQLGEDEVKDILSYFTCPLIAQLGKNYANGNDSLISGSDILQLAMEKVKKVQNEVGGRFVYLKCEEKPKLIKFYETNNFKLFGRRKLDCDETDIKGKYLLQYFAIL